MAPPPEKKKSRTRELNEIAEGAAVSRRGAKDGVADAVRQEKMDEEDDDEDENEDEDEDEDVIDLEDDALAREILVAHHKKNRVVVGKRQKRKPSEGRKKTSVAHVLFEPVEGQRGTFHCRAGPLVASKTGHPSHVKQTAGATSNLISHARTWHLELLEGLIKCYNDHRSVADEFEGILLAATPPSSSKKDLRAHFNTVSRSKVGFETQLSLLIMIVGCSLPFAIIDSRHFKDWMTVVGLQIQSEGTIKKMLLPLYECVLEEQLSFVRKCGFFSITFDMWTSISKQKYLVATYHTMDEGFEMFSAPLDLIPMPCSAFGEFIAGIIQSRQASHKFDECVFMASFSDSGSNCKMARGMLTPGDDEPCFHHTLKLMLDDVIGGAEGGGQASNGDVALDLLSVGLLVAVVRASSQLRSKISSAAGDAGIEKLELIAANITRWEGRYSALKRFVQLQGALVALHKEGIFLPYVVKSKNSFPPDFLKETFFRRLITYEQLLKRFHLISKAGQSQTEPTLSCVSHWVWSMEDEILAESEDDGAVLKRLKQDLLASSKRRMSVFVAIERDEDGDVAIVPNPIKAGLLDPRHSHEVQGRLAADELQAAKGAIIADTLSLIRDEEMHEPIRTAMEGSFGVLLKRMPKAPGFAGSALTWWRDLRKSDAAMVLSHFFVSARIFLSMPAGGAPSECVFSSTTDMVTKKRNCLGDDSLEQMTIVRHFVRSPRYNFSAVAKKMEENAAKQKREEGVQARAAAQEGM